MKALYLQPYVPQYRVPLFDRLSERLRASGGRLTVACGAPAGPQSARQDRALAPWMVDVTSRSWSTPIGEIKYRSGTSRLLADADVCVMELDAGNANAWLQVFRRSRKPLLLWGHGKSFVSSTRRPSEELRRLLARRAQHVMTYSPAGRAHLVRMGIPPSRVTTVGNATDTVELRRLLNDRLRRPTHRSEVFGRDVSDRNVACYVGGLDSDKRIPFLVSAAREAHRIDQRFLLLVAGSGAEQHLLRSAGPALAWAPRVEAEGLADLAAVSRSIWMPGRVGLIAADALALGRPVLTTPFPFHAPEFEFLTPGRSVHVLPDDPTNFARRALELHAGLPAEPAPLDPATPTVDGVAEAMFAVIRGCLDPKGQAAWA